MGYTTDFNGYFHVNPPMSAELVATLDKFAETRQCRDEDKHYNDLAPGAPSLWCDWEPTENGDGIVWNGSEKFYEYDKWLQVIIDRFLVPNGHTLSGEVTYEGEDRDDFGKLVVENNKVRKVPGKRVW